MLIGGEPFDEPIVMWWNFVARTRDEVEAAYRSGLTPAPPVGDGTRVVGPGPNCVASEAACCDGHNTGLGSS
jgi:hypothetical protein